MTGPRLVAAARRAWVLHPRWSLALKGAVAAALAWTVGVLAPAPFSDYPYYAPLGAVIATTSTVARSVRESVQAVGALLLGIVIARAADVVLSPSAFSVALVVGLALLCAGWRWFGQMGTWVATSALFVLILGDVQTAEYVGAFSGLVVVGAAIGIGVNLVLPPLPLTPSERALDRLRDALADHLEELADALDGDEALSVDAWERRRRDLQPVIELARTTMARTHEATRGNPRVRRHRERTEVQGRRAHELGTSAAVVDDVAGLLIARDAEGEDRVVLGPGLRPATGAALLAYAGALRSDAPDGGRAEQAERFAAAVTDLRDRVLAERGAGSGDELVAGALVLALQRGAAALAV